MYTDLLVRIKNAQAVGKKIVKVPFSKRDFDIALILMKNKFLKEASKKGKMPNRIIELILSYKDGKGAIKDFNFISKSSRRIYKGYKELYSVRSGYGMGVISTSKGIMNTKEAKKMKLGGEYLFDLW